MNVSILTASNAATVHTGLAQSLVVLVSLTTVLVFGLAVLRRPSPATTLWGVAFGVGLFATYVWVAADQTGHASVRALAAGLMLTFEPLVWSGLRLFAALGRGGAAVWPWSPSEIPISSANSRLSGPIWRLTA